jgi:LPXTG-motif cell wall-anchored protein
LKKVVGKSTGKSITITILLIFTIFIGLFNILPSVASGRIIDGRIELNKGMVNLEKLFESYQNLSPSNVVSSKEIIISNTGDLPLKIFERFIIDFNQEGLSAGQDKVMLEKYYIKANFKKNNELLNIEGITGKWIQANKLNEIYNKQKDNELATIEPSGNITMQMDVKLDETAGNEYQGAQINIKFLAGGFVNVATNGFALPNTATNSFNFLFAGIILLIIGGILFFRHRRARS